MSGAPGAAAAVLIMHLHTAGAGAGAGGSWDWSRTRTWMEVSNYVPMTASQAEFAATHYDIIGLGGK